MINFFYNNLLIHIFKSDFLFWFLGTIRYARGMRVIWRIIILIWVLIILSGAKKHHPDLLLLDTDIGHIKQTKNLSCEANSLRDLINYYQKKYSSFNLDEHELITVIPTYTTPLKRVKGKLIWWDPDQEFVWNINGRHTTNLKKFTGYGLHASGVLPVAKNYLRRFDLDVQYGTFDINKAVISLKKWHPVMFWYVSYSKIHEDGKKLYTLPPITWYTPKGKRVQGYIGEHVWVLMGVDFQSGRVDTIYYYNGLDDYIVVDKLEHIQPLIDVQNMALYINEASHDKKLSLSS